MVSLTYSIVSNITLLLTFLKSDFQTDLLNHNLKMFITYLLSSIPKTLHLVSVERIFLKSFSTSFFRAAQHEKTISDLT